MACNSQYLVVFHIQLKFASCRAKKTMGKDVIHFPCFCSVHEEIRFQRTCWTHIYTLVAKFAIKRQAVNRIDFKISSISFNKSKRFNIHHIITNLDALFTLNTEGCIIVYDRPVLENSFLRKIIKILFQSFGNVKFKIGILKLTLT